MPTMKSSKRYHKRFGISNENPQCATCCYLKQLHNIEVTINTTNVTLKKKKETCYEAMFGIAFSGILNGITVSNKKVPKGSGQGTQTG